MGALDGRLRLGCAKWEGGRLGPDWLDGLGGGFLGMSVDHFLSTLFVK